MDESAVRDARRVLRQVQEHLFQAHLNLGAERESNGLVDVIHHPTNKLPYLNYVTPRKSTAWVSGKDVEQGLDFLRKLERTPRVHYIEGLFPPLFAKTLRDLGLAVEQETPIMIYKPDAANPLPPPVAPEGITTSEVKDQRGSELWWYVWRNAYYDVLSLGIEPLFVGRDTREIMLGHQIDILAYHYGFPVGVARVTIWEESAHIAGIALMKEMRTPETTKLIYLTAIHAAEQHQCSMVFAPGDSEQDRRLCREMGFVDSGSIVCYSAKVDAAAEESHELPLAQPVLVLR
jgi:hypothetical protein